MHLVKSSLQSRTHNGTVTLVATHCSTLSEVPKELQTPGRLVPETCCLDQGLSTPVISGLLKEPAQRYSERSLLKDSRLLSQALLWFLMVQPSKKPDMRYANAQGDSDLPVIGASMKHKTGVDGCCCVGASHMRLFTFRLKLCPLH